MIQLLRFFWFKFFKFYMLCSCFTFNYINKLGLDKRKLFCMHRVIGWAAVATVIVCFLAAIFTTFGLGD